MTDRCLVAATWSPCIRTTQLRTDLRIDREQLDLLERFRTEEDPELVQLYDDLVKHDEEDDDDEDGDDVDASTDFASMDADLVDEDEEDDVDMEGLDLSKLPADVNDWSKDKDEELAPFLDGSATAASAPAQGSQAKAAGGKGAGKTAGGRAGAGAGTGTGAGVSAGGKKGKAVAKGRKGDDNLLPEYARLAMLTKGDDDDGEDITEV